MRRWVTSAYDARHLEVGADGNHAPDWTDWEPDMMAERRTCLVLGCTLSEERPRSLPSQETTAVLPESDEIPDQIVAEVLINGKPVNPFAVPVCKHTTFMQQVTVALLQDAQGRPAGWRLQARVKCTCGVQFRFDTDGVATSADKTTLGVLVEPVSEVAPAELGWEPVEAT